MAGLADRYPERGKRKRRAGSRPPKTTATATATDRELDERQCCASVSTTGVAFCAERGGRAAAVPAVLKQAKASEVVGHLACDRKNKSLTFCSPPPVKGGGECGSGGGVVAGLLGQALRTSTM